jgi:hypothetical protein
MDDWDYTRRKMDAGIVTWALHGDAGRLATIACCCLTLIVCGDDDVAGGAEKWLSLAVRRNKAKMRRLERIGEQDGLHPTKGVWDQ